MAQLLFTAAPDAPVPAPRESLPARPTPSTADDLAAANYLANVRALSLTQPDLIDASRSRVPPPGSTMTWTFARDGSLTALDDAGRWWDGCSVPLHAARAMLKTLDPNGRVACFLRPTQAAHLHVALAMLRDDQAVVAVIPDGTTLWMVLHCGDFSRAIRDERLWIATGEEWPGELGRIFRDNPGLATPSQFIRLPVTPADEVERLVKAAQGVFAEQNAARAESIAATNQSWRSHSQVRRVCVLAPSHFRLWDVAGSVLAGALRERSDGTGVEIVRFDSDRPGSGSLLALAAAAGSCDAMLAADVGRADLANAVPAEMPWVTWVTSPRVPPAHAAGARDALLLADAAWTQRAADAGWGPDRVHLATWPPVCEPGPAPLPPGDLAIVADTCPLDPPERLGEFSSHLLLWERLRADLAADPFRVTDDPEQFLDRMLRRFGVSPEGLDRRLFVDRLILPAFQQGLAALLLREKLPLRLYGTGWDRLETFRPYAAGPVTSLRQLGTIARQAAAFVHLWPGGHSHPIDALGRPVVRRRDPAGRSFVSDAMRAMGSRAESRPPASPRLTMSVVMESINREAD